MKKLAGKFFIVVSVLVLIATICVSCTNKNDIEELIDSKYVYNETEFVADMAKQKENNVSVCGFFKIIV